MKAVAEKDPYIDAAYQRLMALSEDERKKLEYDTRMKAIWDYNSMMQERFEEGCKQGIQVLVETCRELDISREIVISKIQQKFMISDKEAKSYVEKYWK